MSTNDPDARGSACLFAEKMVFKGPVQNFTSQWLYIKLEQSLDDDSLVVVLERSVRWVAQQISDSVLWFKILILHLKVENINFGN